MSPGKTHGFSIVNRVSRPIATGCKALLPLGSGDPPGQELQERRCVEDCSDAIQNMDFSRGIDDLYMESLAEPGAGTSTVLRTVSSARKRSSEEGTFRKKKRWGVDDDIIDSILELLKHVIVTPPRKIMCTMEWEDNAELHNLPENDRDVTKAFQRWGLKTRRMSTKDFIEFYDSISPSAKFLFQDLKNTGSMYWSVEDSTKHCIAFIDFHTHNNGKEFVSNLLDVLDSRIPKRNTFDVLSAPNCGKTWFFDMICDFYLNVGHVKNFNKYSQFPLQDCRERRVILWNEPNCHPEALDTLKTLFGGDRCAANIKCKDDDVINRTPLIVTGNSRIFPDNTAMNERRFCHNFDYWPDLKEIGKLKLHPLCWKNVLSHFEIQF